MGSGESWNILAIRIERNGFPLQIRLYFNKKIMKIWLEIIQRQFAGN